MAHHLRGIRRFALALITLGWTVSGFGCAVTVDDGTPVVVVPTGTLTVQWTVAGSTDPFACDDFGASDLELLVDDAFGNPVVDVYEPCDSFVVTVDLPEGTFDATATLVDPGNNAVSTSLPLESLDIVADTDLTVDIDFPFGSIL